MTCFALVTVSALGIPDRDSSGKLLILGESSSYGHLAIKRNLSNNQGLFPKRLEVVRLKKEIGQ